MSDPNNIVLKEHNLVLMLPCKVGNSSIKAAFADALGMTRKDLHLASTWNTADKYEIDRLGSGWLVIGFSRHPYARFLSAYRDKLLGKGQYHRVGLEALPTIDYCADMLPSIKDQHWRSMTADLFVGRVMVPDVIFRSDDLPGAWNMARKAVFDHCGLVLGEIPHLNPSSGHVGMTDHAKKAGCRLLRR